MRISLVLAGRIKLIRRFRTFRGIDLLTILAAEPSPPAEGRMALCSTPCSLAALPAELPARVPDPDRDRVVRTRLPVLAGALGQHRLGAEDG